MICDFCTNPVWSTRFVYKKRIRSLGRETDQLSTVAPPRIGIRCSPSSGKARIGPLNLLFTACQKYNNGPGTGQIDWRECTRLDLILDWYLAQAPKVTPGSV